MAQAKSQMKKVGGSICPNKQTWILQLVVYLGGDFLEVMGAKDHLKWKR